MTEQPNNGELLLPVCIPEDDIKDVISALDLYRVLRKGGKNYPAFMAVVDALEFTDNPQDSPCLDIEGGTGGACYRMDTTTEIFDFYPNDPFDPTDDAKTSVGGHWITLAQILDLEDQPDWLVTVLEVLGQYAGYFPNDCFVSYLDDDFGQFVGFDDFWEFVGNLQNVIPFPTVTIKLQGTGQVEIEFPILPLGGRCLIVQDFQPNPQTIFDMINGNFGENDASFTIIELERDLFSSSPEIIPTTIAELEFDTDGEHVIRCFFFPTFEVEQVPFIFPFGGIREVEVCGNIEIIGSQTDTVYTPLNYRNLEAHRRGVVGIMSKEDMRWAVHHGTIDAWSDAVAGRGDGTTKNFANDIQIGKDGEVVVKSGGASLGGKPDVNATPDEIIYGGAMGVGRGFRDFVGDIILRKITQARTAQSVADLLRGFYFLRGLVNSVDLLASAFGTPLDNAIDQVTPVVNAITIANIVYCNGANKQSLYRYALAVEDANGTDASDIASWFRLLIDEIEQEQIDQWYEDGSSIPDSSYSNAPCYIAPATEAIYQGSEVAPSGLRLKSFQPQPVLSAPRRFRVEITGLMTNANGETFDGVYRKPSAGNAIVTTPRLNYNNGSTVTQMSLISTPAYQASGQRVLEFNTVAGLSCKPEYFYWVNSADAFFNAAPITGSLTIRAIDLGSV